MRTFKTSIFFDARTYTWWKKELHILLHLSLSSDAVLDLKEGLNIHPIWNLLKQLIETCYLIRFRLSGPGEKQTIINPEDITHEHGNTSA